MTAWALGVYGVFGVVGLGVRTLLHVRATGRWPLLFPQTPAALIGQGALTLGILGAPAGAVLDITETIDRFLDTDVLRGLGLVMIVAGAAVVVVAQAQMGQSWRAGVDPSDPTDLVTHGLFERVRNPIYSSMILVALGMSLVAANAVTIVSAVLVAIGAEVLVRRVEEPYLSSVHGRAFAQYTARAGRFLPRVGRSPR